MDDLIGGRPSGEVLRRAGSVAGYLVLGVVGTAILGFTLLPLTTPVQAVVYDLFYLQVGPSEATETAVLTHFILSAIAAISTSMVLGDYLSDRLKHRVVLAKGVATMLLLVLVFLLVALAGLAAFLTALVVLAVGLVTVPLMLRYRYDVRSGAIPAFVGGIPVIVFLLLLAGFGLGWGGGYVMTAQEVPASAVDGPVADFDDVPAVGDALFETGDCSTGTDGRRTCHLYLRGSDHEVRAARFMARHGVRCPYQNAPSPGAGRSDAFIAEYQGTFYRVTCSAYGD